ncbi:MAG: F0F1 ATP synthase subunit alpha [Eubacteriales bacterium]|nr:F0F1 ATP synthase subunit alpha [Eubacteriales bacterium]
MTQTTWKTVGQNLKERLGDYERTVDVRSTGMVLFVGDGILHIDGLNDCKLGEMIELESGGFAIAMNLEEKLVYAVALGEEDKATVGMHAYGTGRVLSVPCGDGLLSHVLDPLGMPLDSSDRIAGAEYRPIEMPAPPILHRKPVSVPLQTGLLAIDAMVPIGRGQRELIIGDRQTGKTSIAIDTILNQKGTNVVCIYVAIGQKSSSVAQMITHLRDAGAMEYTTVISATAADSATMQYIAPYAGCAMAEWYMNNGRDVLIVYDDLTKHAIAYRAMSLLLHRPPGREAYPGDVFYLHSRLLERAACLSDDMGGGSMTALPIIETQAGDISAYIPTNVISITDGQIYLDTELFREGIRPAVNGGLSVSRVGGAAQCKSIRKVAGKLRLELAQYRELQVFAQFASDMDAATQDKLLYGEKLTELCKQRNNSPMPLAIQVAFLYAATQGMLPKDMSMKSLILFKEGFPDFFRINYSKLYTALNVSGELSHANETMLRITIENWLNGKGKGDGDMDFDTPTANCPIDENHPAAGEQK